MGLCLCFLWPSFVLLGPCQCLSKTVRLIRDTTAPVSISICTHLSLMPTNTIRGSIFFSWYAEEFVHWGSVSWSNRVCVVVMLIFINLKCPAISGALSAFPFQAGYWKVASFLSEVVSYIPEVTIIRWVLAVTSKTVFRFFLDRNFICRCSLYLCKCRDIGAGCYVVNIFVRTFHRLGYLSSLGEIQLFSANKHLQIRSSATPTTSKSLIISWILGLFF